MSSDSIQIDIQIQMLKEQARAGKLPGVKGQWLKVGDHPPSHEYTDLCGMVEVYSDGFDAMSVEDVLDKGDRLMLWRPDSGSDDRPFLQDSRILTYESMQKWALKDPLVHRAIQAGCTELQLIEALVEDRERLIKGLVETKKLNVPPFHYVVPASMLNANPNP
jgi:hypothetical protein